VTLTYPGTKQITATGACSFVPGPFGTITIDVPIADVSLDAGVSPLSSRLYSVTASTMTLLTPPEAPPPVSATIPVGDVTSVTVRRLGGAFFDLIDVVRAYDFLPGTGGGGGGGGCREGDGDGHIRGENSGSASFHFHKNTCQDGDDQRVDASDSSGNMDFHSTQILSVGFDDVAHTMTITGLGTDNGAPVAFTAVGVDSTLVPPGAFTITLSDGYSNGGSLLDGSIALQ
jgi:hypothetical protein